jgi:UrcA family protein
MKSILISAAAIAAASLVAGGAYADQKRESVNVEASRVVSASAGRSTSGIPVTKLSFTYEVNLDDLDLAQAPGLAEAEKRVNNAAAAACAQIGKEVPESVPSDRECTKQAANKALAKVHSAAAAAKAPKK